MTEQETEEFWRACGREARMEVLAYSKKDVREIATQLTHDPHAVDGDPKAVRTVRALTRGMMQVALHKPPCLLCPNTGPVAQVILLIPERGHSAAGIVCQSCADKHGDNTPTLVLETIAYNLGGLVVDPLMTHAVAGHA